MLEQITAILITEKILALTLLFFTTVIVIYSIFVFYFYRFLAKKNIIELNLNQYNQYSNPFVIKIFAIFFYIIEYIVLLPILTFFWFGILAILTLILAKDLPVDTVLLIAAALVASIRVTSYVNEDLAKDLAKMLPLTLLAIAITTAGFFNRSIFFERIGEIPDLFSNVPYYLIFIIGIELIMRVMESITSFPRSEEEATEE
jgi:hypothetical protein|tara:strand:+ start:1065 stop:1670 length:606 start_codon:yes stop_codon:yes gene_type:complete